jgi:hypothetical protein
VLLSSQIREAKRDRPAIVTTLPRKGSITADPRSPLHINDHQTAYDKFSPRGINPSSSAMNSVGSTVSSVSNSPVIPLQPFYSLPRRNVATASVGSPTENNGISASSSSSSDSVPNSWFNSLQTSAGPSSNPSSKASTPSEKAYTPRFAAQKEKDSKPMSELERKFASRKSKSDEN